MSITITTEYVCFARKRLERFKKYETMFGNIYSIARGNKVGKRGRPGSLPSMFINQDMAKRMVALLEGPSVSIDGHRHVSMDVHDAGIKAFQELVTNLRKTTALEFCGEDADRFGDLMLEEIRCRADRLEDDLVITYQEDPSEHDEV